VSNDDGGNTRSELLAPVFFRAKDAADNLNDWRVTEANRRQSILEAFDALIADGYSRAKAAKKVGIGYVTIWRWQTRRAEKGYDGLLPSTDECGRTSAWETVLENEKFCAKLMEIYLATIGASGSNVVRGRRTAKIATALGNMAQEPECPEALSDRLRRGKFPVCLVRYLKRITPEMENRLRGAKHYQLNGVESRRDLTIRFPDGSRADMPAGFKWVFDDVSFNQPFYVECDGKIMFSRQSLCAIDHRSLRWLGKMLVARPREAYRSEDILRFLRSLFLAYGGKPDVIVFEQGVWRARKIHGFKMSEYGEPIAAEFDRPDMAEGEKHLLTDGLAAIGIKVIFATSAHGKIIESCFNPLQTQMAIRTREFVNIGRYGGEFEIPGKRLAQVRAESRTPSFLGFAPANILSDRVDESFVFINAKVNSRKEIPDEIWAQDIAKRPLLENQPADAAVFLPEVRERQIDGGRVTLQVNNQVHDFRAPWMIELGSGYKVFCRFDPAEPSRGAAIYNRETGTANFKEFKAGQFIGFAAWEMPAPSVDVNGPVRGIVSQAATDFYGDGAFDQGDAIRKKQNKLVATFFSALPRPGQPAVKMHELRDGEGRVSRVESTSSPAAVAGPLPTLAPAAAVPVPRARSVFAPRTPEELKKQSQAISRRAANANRLRETQNA